MSIEARLTLNPDDYTAALEEASKSTENFKKKAEQAGQSFSDSAKKAGTGAAQAVSQATAKAESSWSKFLNRIKNFSSIPSVIQGMAGGGLLGNLIIEGIKLLPTIAKEAYRLWKQGKEAVLEKTRAETSRSIALQNSAFLNFAVSMSTDSFRTFAACQTLIGWTASSVKTGRDCLADRHS